MRTLVTGATGYSISDWNCYTGDHVVDIANRVPGNRSLRLRISAQPARAAGWLSENPGRGGSVFNYDKATGISQSCWVCAPGKARAELGYQLEYNLERGMGEDTKWYQEQGWL